MKKAACFGGFFLYTLLHIISTGGRIEKGGDNMEIFSDDLNICKNCGEQLFGDISYCRFCGKSVRRKNGLSWKKCFLVTLLVLIVVAASAFSAFFITNYHDAVTAMDHQEFISAKWHLNKIPLSEKLFSQESEYINAGILMEKGRYAEALKAFKKLSFPVPASAMETVTEKIYQQAIRDYHNANFDEAQAGFRLIVDYERCEDYLTLIRNRTPYYGNCDELIDLLDFEDAKSILLENEICFEQFISGDWKTQNGSNYFKIHSNGNCTYNLPAFSVSGSFCTIKNGIYYEGKQGSEDRMQFKFSIVDKNTISVHCYKNSKTYTLIRQ